MRHSLCSKAYTYICRTTGPGPGLPLVVVNKSVIIKGIQAPAGEASAEASAEASRKVVLAQKEYCAATARPVMLQCPVDSLFSQYRQSN